MEKLKAFHQAFNFSCLCCPKDFCAHFGKWISEQLVVIWTFLLCGYFQTQEIILHWISKNNPQFVLNGNTGIAVALLKYLFLIKCTFIFCIHWAQMSNNIPFIIPVEMGSLSWAIPCHWQVLGVTLPFTLTRYCLLRQMWHYKNRQQHWLWNECYNSTEGGTSVLATVRENSGTLRGSQSLIKSPTSRVGSFVFLSFLPTPSQICGFPHPYPLFYNLWDFRNYVMGFQMTTLGQSLLLDKFLSKNNQKSSIPPLKGEPLFQFCCPTICWVILSSFGPRGWISSLNLYVLLQRVMKCVFVWVGLLERHLKRKQHSFLSCDWDKSRRMGLCTLSLSVNLGGCLV